ncbi:MAG: T9SS type A sorting domain-containing protein, partial [Prevotellaceae bacterium]|nr:T9SS type A sorting domain-containing protein [Prevotellaceae bacterium]
GGVYAEGDTATLTAVPTGTATFAGWQNSAGETVSTVDTLIIAVESDAALTAGIAAQTPTQTFTLYVSVYVRAMGSATGGGVYAEGATATLTAVPTGTATFAGWQNSVGETVSTVDTLFIAVERDTALTAVFAAQPQPQTYTVTVSVNNQAWGSATGGGAYAEGATATLTAVPAGTATFAGWQNSAGETVSTSNPYAVAVTGDVAFTAIFAATSTGVGTLAAGSLTIYPNPTTGGRLTIENGSVKPGEKIEVYSLSGSLVATFAVTTGVQTVINVSHLPHGAYIVKLGNRAAKIVING